jgi:hypothetical protein
MNLTHVEVLSCHWRNHRRRAGLIRKKPPISKLDRLMTSNTAKMNHVVEKRASLMEFWLSRQCPNLRTLSPVTSYSAIWHFADLRLQIKINNNIYKLKKVCSPWKCCDHSLRPCHLVIKHCTKGVQAKTRKGAFKKQV